MTVFLWWYLIALMMIRGSKDLWNVGKLLPDYTALQPRRQPSLYSPPWEPQILFMILNCWKIIELLLLVHLWQYTDMAGEGTLFVSYKMETNLNLAGDRLLCQFWVWDNLVSETP
jgi:hypothetical protein